MPTFDVTSPEGKNYEVTVPEGVTANDVLAHFQSQTSSANTAQPPLPSQLPAQGVQSPAMAQPEAQAPQNRFDQFQDDMRERGARLANIIQGANGYGQTPGEKIYQGGVNAANSGVNALTSLANAGIANSPPVQAGLMALQAGYHALPNGAQDFIGGIGDKASSLAQMMDKNNKTYAAQNPRAAANFEATRELANLLPFGNKGVQNMAGEAIGEGANALKNVAMDSGRQLASPIVPIVDEATAPLAQRARDFGIDLRADQVAPSRLRNTIQKVSQELPFSGVDKAEHIQREQWNQALAGTIGEKNLEPESIEKFISRNSNDFEKVLENKNITIEPSFMEELEKVKLKKSADSKQAIDDYIDDIRKNTQDGMISGKILNSVRSSFIRDLPKKSGDIKHGLGQILDNVDDLVDQNLSPKEQARLGIARNQYRNFKTVEPLLERATNGEINPTDLMNKVASSKYIKASRKSVGEDDLVDLARVGKQFLPKKGGSDTAQKTLLLKVATGGIGSGGLVALAMTNPAAAALAAGLTGAGLALNRGGQAINQSQALIDFALKNAKKRRKL